jgi:hypothetical protein
MMRRIVAVFSSPLVRPSGVSSSEAPDRIGGLARNIRLSVGRAASGNPCAKKVIRECFPEPLASTGRVRNRGNGSGTDGARTGAQRPPPWPRGRGASSGKNVKTARIDRGGSHFFVPGGFCRGTLAPRRIGACRILTSNLGAFFPGNAAFPCDNDRRTQIFATIFPVWDLSLWAIQSAVRSSAI